MVAPMAMTHARFFALGTRAQADEVWRELFVDRTPISEACVGVLTTLAAEQHKGDSMSLQHECFEATLERKASTLRVLPER